jgi:RsiW-degrading membrane proteinase PrsW (M82 family)
MATISTDWFGYASHFLIDVMATAATLYAQRFCQHRWHQVLVWLGLSLVVTFTTVNLIG